MIMLGTMDGWLSIDRVTTCHIKGVEGVLESSLAVDFSLGLYVDIDYPNIRLKKILKKILE